MICDVADTAALRRALDEVAATLGPVDLLVNNAARTPACGWSRSPKRTSATPST